MDYSFTKAKVKSTLVNLMNFEEKNVGVIKIIIHFMWLLRVCPLWERWHGHKGRQREREEKRWKEEQQKGGEKRWREKNLSGGKISDIQSSAFCSSRVKKKKKAKQKNRTAQKPLLYKQDSRHVHMHLFSVNFQSKCSKQPCPKHPSLDRLSAAPETVTQKCFEQSW